MEGAPITLVGGGLAGTWLAARLLRQGWAVRLIEAQRWSEAPPPERDLRTLALSRSSWQALADVGVTPGAVQASVIRRIHVSSRGRPGRVMMEARDEDLDDFGHTVGYGHLLRALRQALQGTPGLVLHDGCQAQDVGGSAVAARVTWRDAGGAEHTGFAPLVVVADGGGGDTPELAWRYRQDALVCRVETDSGCSDLAYERFTPQGPLALLPSQPGFALIWTGPPARVDALLACDDSAFLAALQDWFGDRAGRFVRCSARMRYPLAARFRMGAGPRRVVRIANAAQTLHPVAGQGFNLGLRDAATLATLLGPAAGPGSPPADQHAPPWIDRRDPMPGDRKDPGAPALLADFRRRRAPDRAVTSGITHLLAEAFALPVPGLAAGSALAFALLDGSPRLRTGFARLMGAGLGT